MVEDEFFNRYRVSQKCAILIFLKSLNFNEYNYELKPCQ